MNKYQKSIEFFIKLKLPLKAMTDEFCELCHNSYLALKELVDKATPKKPTYEGDGYDDSGELIYDTWYCPCCDKRYEVDYDNYDYCPSCGQAIDWSGEGEGERNEK